MREKNNTARGTEANRNQGDTYPIMAMEAITCRTFVRKTSAFIGRRTSTVESREGHEMYQ